MSQHTLNTPSPFSSNERAQFKHSVFENIINSTRSLLDAAEKLDFVVQPHNESHKAHISEIDCEELFSLSPSTVVSIKSLWSDPGLQTCLQRSNEFNIQDTSAYFIEHLKRFTTEPYTPTDKDILMLRKRTSSLTTTDFTIKTTLYRVIDVGGQKSYRGSWAKFFDDSKAVLFVISIAGYDQFMEEDPSTNRMVDSMNLFGETVSNTMLKNVKIILLMNKTDLLEKKLKVSSLRKYFSDLSKSRDDTEMDTAKAYFKYKFVEIQKKHSKNKLFIHFTNSTDTELMKNIIDAIMEIVINYSLTQAGLIV